jgi:hypothetical protein
MNKVTIESGAFDPAQILSTSRFADSDGTPLHPKRVHLAAEITRQLKCRWQTARVLISASRRVRG